MSRPIKITALAVALSALVGLAAHFLSGGDPAPTVRALAGSITNQQPPGGGGGGDITAVTAGPGLAGGGAAGAVTLELNETGCNAGEVLTWQSADTWTCEPPAGGSGDLTEIQVTSPIAGSSLTGPIPSLSLSTTGCVDGETWQRVGGAWVCDPVGDITGVTASTGLTGGGSAGAVSLAVDTSVVQARVTGTCAAGSSIRVIDSAGAVTCETDDNAGGDITEVQVGRGLAVTSGTGPIPSLRTLAPNDGWRCYDEFVSLPATTGGCAIAGTANSGTVTLPNIADADHPGVFTLTTTSNASSRAGFLSPNATSVLAFTANANFSFETWINLSSLSDGTDTYILRAGFLDSTVGEPTDALMFRYNQASSTAMQCVVRANNVETSVNSSFTVVATTWTKLRLEVDGVSAVRFFINGSEVCAATAVTNLPIGVTRGLGYGINMIRSAGTASRTTDLDYLDVIGTFVTTPR